MATYTIVKFKNLTPLHVGTGKENYDFSASELHSDTLSAALAAIRAQQGKTDDVEDFLQSFVISSAFPFVGESLFLPKPQGKIDVSVTDMKEYPSRKKLKKVRYLESSLWNKVISGQKIEVKKEQLQGEFLLLEGGKCEFNPFKSQVNQRVSVPREDNQPAEPFFFEWKYFNSNAGLYCLLDSTEDMKQEIISLLQFLGEVGLGTDKNLGGGKFEVDVDELSIDEPANANAEMLLSLYIPAETDLPVLNLPDSRYELLLRGGYMAGSDEPTFRHLRKKSVYTFNVGSVFSTQARLMGKIVDLKPEWNNSKMHSVFRSGRPFVVSVNVNDHE